MPQAYTHILVGKECLKIVERLKVYNNAELFYLGCMGPDLFSYQNLYTWIKNRPENQLADKMHNQYCGPFIIDALKYIKGTSKSKNELDQRAVYMMGYLCHYIMDKTMHPYVFYKTGLSNFYNKKNPETYIYRYSHTMLEMVIDYHMAKKIEGSDVHKIKVYEYFDVGKSVPSDIKELYNHMFSIYFKDYVSSLSTNLINESYKGMKLIWRFIYDPNNMKGRLLKLFNKDYFLYPKAPYEKDYMNINKKIWYHPCDKNIYSNKSLYELFNDAVYQTSVIINCAIDYLNGDASIDTLQKLVGNYSFDTGLDIKKHNQNMEYFDPIY